MQKQITLKEQMSGRSLGMGVERGARPMDMQLELWRGNETRLISLPSCRILYGLVSSGKTEFTKEALREVSGYKGGFLDSWLIDLRDFLREEQGTYTLDMHEMDSWVLGDYYDLSRKYGHETEASKPVLSI